MAIQRLNYFNGQFLREADFKVEQDYHLSMRRAHNRQAHGMGIVTGLEVTAGSNQVTIKAGMAIDADGREIIVSADTVVPIAANAANVHVVVALAERKTDKAVDPDPIQFETRWTESPVFDVLGSVPAGAIGLAQVTAVSAAGVVTLDAAYRRNYSAPAAEGDLTIGRDLTVLGKLEVKGQTTLIDTGQMRGDVVLGDADTDQVTLEGLLISGHSSGVLQIASPTAIDGSLSVAVDLVVQENTRLSHVEVNDITIADTVSSSHSPPRVRFLHPVHVTGDIDVTGDIRVSGTVAGRDVSADGSTLDNHAADSSNPHATTAAQVDAQGGVNRIAAQINAGTGVINQARIDSAVAREIRFHPATGHDHDGVDSKKIAPGSLEGVSASVTANALNVLTAGANSNAAALHTHPFVPADGSVSLPKLDVTTRTRLLKSPLLAQSTLVMNETSSLGSLPGGIAFDGNFLWVLNASAGLALKIDLLANAVSATVVVDSYPVAVCFGAGAIWVANWGRSTVSRIDLSTPSVVATLSVRSGPNVLVVGGNFLWVASYWDNSVSKIDMATNTVVATVAVGSNPTGLAVVGAFVWVANLGSNSVSKIDLATNTVVATVAVGSQPRALAATSATFLWVANSGANSVSKIDVGSQTVVATVPVQSAPYTLAVIGNFLWVGESYQLQKFDTTTNTAVATVSAPSGVWGNGMVSLPGFLWVCGSFEVSKIDVTANTVSASLRPLECRGMAFDGLNLWVAIFGSGQIVKIDILTRQILSTLAVGLKPHSVAYNGSHVFVTNFGSNSVSKIDPLTDTVVATIPVGTNPAGIAVNPYYQTVWVANSGDGTVSVFDANANSVGSTVPVGANPQALAFDSPYWLCVANTGGNTLSRVGAWVGGTVQSTVTVAAGPRALAFDHANLWVITTGANNLTKIAAGSATATTVPLPAGAVPAKMCFNGIHLLVLCTNGQIFKVEVLSNAVTQTTVYAGLGSGSSGGLVYDGLFTWSVDDNQAYLYKSLV